MFQQGIGGQQHKGPAGGWIGKTTLALHFAHQVADRFGYGKALRRPPGFDPVGPPMSPAEAIRLLLDALAVPAEMVRGGLDGQAGLRRSLVAGRRILLVLDNARDVDQVRPGDFRPALAAWSS